MLATCVAVVATTGELTSDGEPAGVTVDGCSTPLSPCSLAGLARAFARLTTAADGTPEGRVAVAMRGHPRLLGGSGAP